jgi:hypothetical protein
MDPRLDRPDLDVATSTRYTLVDGPNHVLAPADWPVPGYYRAVFATEADDAPIERFLTDAGYGAVLRRTGQGSDAFSAEEFEDWTVAPDVMALQARYDAEAGQGA